MYADCMYTLNATPDIELFTFATLARFYIIMYYIVQHRMMVSVNNYIHL